MSQFDIKTVYFANFHIATLISLTHRGMKNMFEGGMQHIKIKMLCVVNKISLTIV